MAPIQYFFANSGVMNKPFNKGEHATIGTPGTG